MIFWKSVMICNEGSDYSLPQKNNRAKLAALHLQRLFIPAPDRVLLQMQIPDMCLKGAVSLLAKKGLPYLDSPNHTKKTETYSPWPSENARRPAISYKFSVLITSNPVWYRRSISPMMSC